MTSKFETAVGSVKLDTPLLLASGYITETPEFFLKAKAFGCAAMVTRSLKQHVPQERSRIPVPRYVVEGNMMLNAEWGNERPWTEWRDYGVAAVKATGSPIIVSLSGRDIESCTTLIQAFDPLGVDAYEINISCSHSGALHGNLNVDVEHLRLVLTSVRKLTTTPIWIKLSYSSLLLQMAAEAERLGADAIVCTNSIGPGMIIDTTSGKPKLGIKGGAGGMTGPAIFPIALQCVYQLAETVKIPIVGVGGIASPDNVIQMLMAGASAVQLYTEPALKGPRVFKRIMRGLGLFLATRTEFNRITDTVGITHRHRQEHSFASPVPKVLEELCTGCRICADSCVFDALIMVPRPGQAPLAVIKDNCIACNACVGVCPPKFGAIVVEY